jgi:hypothetical protein
MTRRTSANQNLASPKLLNAQCNPDLDLNCDLTADVRDIIPFLWTEANMVPTLQPGCKPIGAEVG